MNIHEILITWAQDRTARISHKQSGKAPRENNLSNTTFAALGCNEPILAALDQRGYTTPTPVQAECFAHGLEGRNLLVQSRTGSGKTLAFGLPLLHRLKADRYPQAIILAPTRELAQQVAEELESVSKSFSKALLVGGTSYAPQLKSLHYGAQVIVGTPGRVMDHLDRGTLDLSQVSMVVLDECDEMLNMGFLEDVETILAKAPKERQTFLFSATLPGPIATLAKRFIQDPVRIELTGAGGAAQHADIAHTPCLISEHFHTQALVNFLLKDEPESALIFTKRKQDAEDVAESLREAGLAAEHLHGDLAQGTRNRILASFKESKLRYLVATDVAARGIDVEGLPLVIHLGIPTQLENYIHRSGRTGRAGSKGTSLALVNFKESRILLAWARRANLKLEWRSVPTQAEIKTARMEHLEARLSKVETQTDQAPLPNMDIAARLLEKRSAESLLASLLGLLAGDSHAGFFIPDAPKKDKQQDRPRAKFSEDFKPHAKPRFGGRDEDPKKRTYERPSFSKPSEGGSEKRPFVKSDRRPPLDRPATGTPFVPKNSTDKSCFDRPAKTFDKPYDRPAKPSFEKSGKPYQDANSKTGKPFVKRAK